MRLKPPDTINHLVLLILIFISGLLLLIASEIYFKGLIADLDNKTYNLKSKIEIGKYLSNDLNDLRIYFYEIFTIGNKTKSKKILNQKIDTKLKQISTILDILDNGGVLKREVKLNLVDHSKTTTRLVYEKNNTIPSVERIDLSPKIEQFLTKIKKVETLVSEQALNLKSKNLKKIIKTNKKILVAYKEAPAFFKRLEENSHRLLYEGYLQLDELKEKLQKQKIAYTKTETILTFLILLVVLFVGSVIAMQINKNTKKLILQEESTRAILDGQPNIVVVSDGQKMLQGNNALIDFFEDYNDFEDFARENKCICDFFIDMNNPEYLIDKDYNGKRWYHNLLYYPEKSYKVAMKSGHKLEHFSITARMKRLNDDVSILIIVLTNISKQVIAQNQLKDLNENLETRIKEKTEKLQDLNANLENRIEEEVKINRDKDKQLMIQSRFASLGEMIGNIAHQWRQPLSVISTIASSGKLSLEMNISTKQDAIKSYDDIINQVNYLSNTIDDFRTFFIQDKTKVSFNVADTLNNCLSLVTASYNSSNIQIIFDYDKNVEYICIGIPNELLQVFINILNNAKDALRDINIDTKVVRIKIEQNEQNVNIHISDNGGGINEAILDKIFDPYFSTKHKTQGTGIGLYMSKEIIQKHMNGELRATNCSFKIKQNSYKGACFTIQLPKI